MEFTPDTKPRESNEGFGLVVASDDKLEVGTTFQSEITDQNLVHHQAQIFHVISESNFNEWIKCLEMLGTCTDDDRNSEPKPYYYRVSTD